MRLRGSTGGMAPASLVIGLVCLGSAGAVALGSAGGLIVTSLVVAGVVAL